MEAFEPKWLNPILDIIGVNSLRLGDLHLDLNFFRLKLNNGIKSDFFIQEKKRNPFFTFLLYTIFERYPFKKLLDFSCFVLVIFVKIFFECKNMFIFCLRIFALISRILLFSLDMEASEPK